MKKIFLAMVLVTAGFSVAAHAEATACEGKAVEKHLNGAAKTSFIKKCEKDAGAASAADQCAAKAAEKKLNGAAKNSFVKKCVTDASK